MFHHSAMRKNRLKTSAGASLVAQTVRNLCAMQETQVQYLGQEGPLEEGMATLSSILAWRIPWTEEPGRLQSMGSQRVKTDGLIFFFTVFCHSAMRRNRLPIDCFEFFFSIDC